MSVTRTAGERRGGSSAARWVLALLLGVFAPGAALAQTTVTTVGGGPTNLVNDTFNGFQDGNTLQIAKFDTPSGLVLDISGRYLFLADAVNGAIRRLDLTANNTITYLSSLSTPVDVALDASTNLYVLTQGDGLIRQYDQFGQLITTNNAAVLTVPTALAYDGSANLYVIELGGALKRVALSNGAVTTIVAAGTFTTPRGVEVLDNGTIAVSDTGNHAIRLINPTTFAVSLLSGLVGTSGTNVGTAAQSRFSSPFNLAKAGGNVLVVTDQGNHRVVTVATNGFTSVLYGIASNNWQPAQPGIFPGWADGTAEFAESRTPGGVVVDGSGNVFVTEQFYHVIRRASGSGLTGPSGVGTGGSSTVTLNPPSLSFSPNTGYFPLGTLVTVTSSSANVYFTTDGTEPTTNSTAVTMSSGIGEIHWSSPTNDLTGLRVAAFVFSGTSSASTNVTGVAATATTIGVPAGLNTNILAGVGSRVVVPIVLNLRTNDTLRSLQFRVEVSTNGAAPMIGSTFGAQAISTNDFVTVTTGGSAATFSTLAYSNTFGTRGQVISFISTNSGLVVNRFAVAALLTVPIPATATEGQTYSIDVLLPTGTTDGATTPVTLATGGTRHITVTNVAYRVGDTSPGGWYNAGDFGNGVLDSADVNNAFAAAAGVKQPFAFSDAFDAMDVFPEDTAGTVGGDGQIRFLDWQIILIRSLRLNTNTAAFPGLSTNNWFRRWSAAGRTNNATNVFTPTALRAAELRPAGEVWHRQAAIGALQLENVQPGAVVNVPVFARVAPGAQVAGLQFRAVITPQNGGTALSQRPQFISLNNQLVPSNTDGTANSVAVGWSLGQLALPGLSSNVLGVVSFRIPVTAPAGSSYAVRFANADGSPDLFNQYNFETRGASVWVQRAAPAPVSLISDEWKVAFFGSATSPAAADLADPDGDGVPNVLEYFAGTDPTSATSRVQLKAGGWRNGGREVALQLLSAPGKFYVLESSVDLVSPVWVPVVTNLGDGNLKELIQTVTPGGPRYYRLRVVP
jgi:hypothetical protein